MRKRVMAFVLVGMLSLAAVPAVYGQTDTGTTGEQQQQNTEIPWGLLGLLGLAGLMGRTREKTRTTQERSTAH